jgi:hypothetical protein
MYSFLAKSRTGIEIPTFNSMQVGTNWLRINTVSLCDTKVTFWQTHGVSKRAILTETSRIETQTKVLVVFWQVFITIPSFSRQTVGYCLKTGYGKQLFSQIHSFWPKAAIYYCHPTLNSYWSRYSLPKQATCKLKYNNEYYTILWHHKTVFCEAVR